ncbi:MAG: hypothetical protein JWM05_2017 [Acidimicrobiales bacterium]|nr:hypothetical protein [Acidimicrobiales bacterium]
MARIRASCATCGDVELTTAQVSVQICTDDGQGTYSFRCPTCEIAISKPAESRIIELLVSSGVRLSTWSMPAELAEVRSGPPITHDDLLDFHDLLERDDWLDSLDRITRQ